MMNKYFRFYTDRIGHMCSNTELFLREKYTPGDRYIGLVDDYIANQTILNMFSRVFCDKIIYNKFYRDFIHWVKPKDYVFHYDFRPNSYDSFKGEPLLEFTEREEQQGKNWLDQMGVDSWFVCFHNRDSSYLDKRKERHKDFAYHDYRDCSIQNQLSAMEYITKQGGFAIRMGYITGESLETDNPWVIDYATRFRSDFMDIYLPAHAKFFVGATAGLACVAYLFNTPCVMINITPLEYIDMPKPGFFIPKLVFSEHMGRLLSFREILNNGVGCFMRTIQFDEKNLLNIENSSDEILEVCQEMNMYIDGNRKDKQKKLQDKYWGLVKPRHRCYDSPVRIGSGFVKRHEELLI